MSENEIYRQYYGKNYDKAMKNARLAVKRARLEFKQKYPSGNIKKFNFKAEVSTTGDITGTSITYMFSGPKRNCATFNFNHKFTTVQRN